jgi:hypothetical protein
VFLPFGRLRQRGAPRLLGIGDRQQFDVAAVAKWDDPVVSPESLVAIAVRPRQDSIRAAATSRSVVPWMT